MKNFFGKVKDSLFGKAEYEEESEKEMSAKTAEYVEIDTAVMKAPKQKVLVKTFFLEEFEDIKPILDDLRDGRTIALVNIRPLKEKDLIELKRAINKIKKTTDAIEGEIAGFGDDYIVVVPAFAKIHRTQKQAPAAEPTHSKKGSSGSEIEEY